jgi:hypothetical protein
MPSKIFWTCQEEMLLLVAWKQPALRTACDLILHGLRNPRQEDHCARLVELGVDGLDVQVAFAEIYLYLPL